MMPVSVLLGISRISDGEPSARGGSDKDEDPTDKKKATMDCDVEFPVNSACLEKHSKERERL